MADYIATIKADSSGGLRDPEISEKIFLAAPAAGLNNLLLSYRIQKTIAEQLGVPITRVAFCGSAGLGVSPHKGTPFNSATSDVDVAVIDHGWFAKMLEAAQVATRGYTDLTTFDRTDDPVNFAQYISNKGMLRPDLMPRCSIRYEWLNKFRSISDRFAKEARKISGAIYLSESFFISKQCSAIRAIKAMP